MTTAAATPQVRRLTPADVEVVVDLGMRAWAPVSESFATVLGSTVYRHVYPDWTTSQADAIRTVCGGAHVFVADLDGADGAVSVVGFVAIALRDDSPRTAEVDMIAVDPDHQRRGVGAELMRFAIEYMREHGVVVADIATGGDPGHAPARRVYEEAGFTPLPLVRYYKVL